MKLTRTILAAAGLTWAAFAVPQCEGQGPDGTPRVSRNRREMLQTLDELKSRAARLPYSPAADAAEGTAVNNRRLRELYLPALFKSSDASTRQPDQDPVLDHRFATQLFWIVSRVNDCAYCLGHQEGKLKKVGVDEQGLLALDTDWSTFSEPQRVAFDFARRLTNSPQRIGQADIDALCEHYTADQALLIIYWISRYNATNRWTDATGIPQETYRDFSTQLSDDALALPSQVASDSFPPRSRIADFDAWRERLDAVRRRTARLTPSQPSGTAPTQADVAAKPDRDELRMPHEQWLAAIPQAGLPAVRAMRAAARVGSLPESLKDQIAFVAAFEDQAWYMQAVTLEKLIAQGLTSRQAFELAAGNRQGDVSAAENAALDFAVRLTSQPIGIGDADIAGLADHFSPQQIAEIIHTVGIAATLNRFTESIGLGLKDSLSLAAVSSSPQTTDATLTRDQPRPTPVTRPEMKQMLEQMKARAERIPLPPLSESESADADPRSTSYEGRLGKLYLPDSSGVRSYLNFGGYSPRRNQGAPNRLIPEPDPALALDYGFKTRLFWIASRANNCQYCLGHQESKLLAVGMPEDQIAALDSDWSSFPPAEQAAFKLARRLTLEPHLLTDADIDECRKHFKDLEILEMVLSVSGNNAINRWKEGVGVPQSTGGGNFGGTANEAHSYLTATSDLFKTAPSRVINESPGSSVGKFVPTRVNRGSQADSLSVSEQLAHCADREPRLPLASEAVTREVLGELAPQGPLPGWLRLLAQFPVAGKRQVTALLASEQDLQLSPLLRAQLAWVIARQNGAAYSLAEAHRRLGELGQSAAQIAALDEIGELAGPASPGEKETALLVVAKHLAAAPVILTDAQVDEAVRLAGPRDVVQTVHYTAVRSLFDRFTEAAGLPADR